MDEGNGKFNLMLLCWGEGHSSAVHDHADAHCFMKMLDGNLREVRFAWPSDSNSNTGSPATESVVGVDAQELQPIGSSLLEVNGVCYINGNYIFYILKRYNKGFLYFKSGFGECLPI